MGEKNKFKVFSKVKAHHDFMWDYVKELLQIFRRPAMIFLIFSGFSIMLFFGGALYFIERNANNPMIHTYFDALYFSVTVMTTVGLGDVHPITPLGRAVSMVMMIIGSGLFVSFTAVISAAIVEIESQKHRNQNNSETN